MVVSGGSDICLGRLPRGAVGLIQQAGGVCGCQRTRKAATMPDRDGRERGSGIPSASLPAFTPLRSPHCLIPESRLLPLPLSPPDGSSPTPPITARSGHAQRTGASPFPPRDSAAGADRPRGRGPPNRHRHFPAGREQPAWQRGPPAGRACADSRQPS